MPTTPPPTARPRSRAAQQRATRQALVETAGELFARDGYHGANLARIAEEAGYSKGAVYSNFAGKAELFLAVMDQDLDRLERIGPRKLIRNEDTVHRAASMRGFGLATLEFVATAVRDPDLAVELRARIELLAGAYREIVATEAPHDPLGDDALAMLLTALDQGVGVLTLMGVEIDEAELLDHGVTRLLDGGRDGGHAR